MTTLEIIDMAWKFLSATGIFSVIVFYNSKKRTASANAQSAELNAQGLLVNQYEIFINSLQEMNDTQKKDNANLRNDIKEYRALLEMERAKNLELVKEKSDALVELEIIKGENKLLEYNKCLKNPCPERKPPRKTK